MDMPAAKAADNADNAEIAETAKADTPGDAEADGHEGANVIALDQFRKKSP